MDSKHFQWIHCGLYKYIIVKLINRIKLKKKKQAAAEQTLCFSQGKSRCLDIYLEMFLKLWPVSIVDLDWCHTIQCICIGSFGLSAFPKGDS